MSRVKSKISKSKVKELKIKRTKQKQKEIVRQKPVNFLVQRMGLPGKNRALLNSQ